MQKPTKKPITKLAAMTNNCHHEQNVVDTPCIQPPHSAASSPVSEAELLEAIEHVVSVLCGTFSFGYYHLDDIRQEARLFCLEALPKYDQKRDLKKFLYVHVHNRLLNLQRDKLVRNDPPCKLCHSGQACQNSPQDENMGGDEQRQVGCARYMGWLKRNVAKKSLAAPGQYSEAVQSRHIDPSSSQSILESLANAEILEIIDRNLPASFRANYLRMREGAKVSKSVSDKVLHQIRCILSRYFPEFSLYAKNSGVDAGTDISKDGRNG